MTTDSLGGAYFSAKTLFESKIRRAKINSTNRAFDFVQKYTASWLQIYFVNIR